VIAGDRGPASADSSNAGFAKAGWPTLGLTLLVAAFATPRLALAQDRGLDVLRAAAERYAAVETLCADFTQHLSVPLLGRERTGTGRLCQGRPNLFAMRFTDPPGDVIVVDGDFTWVYFPSNDAKTVLKTSAERSAGGRDFHREFLEDPESKYDVEYEGTEVVAGHPTHRLRMRPKGPASYRSAVVWIDEGIPVLRQLRLEEENGSVRTITLANVGFDVDPGAGWFSFTPPEGALVMVR
jgi:outer membrane lipoprotein-sorting protein